MTMPVLPGMFDPVVLPVLPVDPTVSREEAPRLSKQCAAILQRLEQGPATNVQLAAIALKYTSRLSDIRAWLTASGDSRQVECYHQNKKTGESWYQLVTR